MTKQELYQKIEELHLAKKSIRQIERIINGELKKTQIHEIVKKIKAKQEQTNGNI